MRLIEELNILINEALGWDTNSEEYKQMMEENKSITEAFSNACENIGFKLTDTHRLKDGTGRIVYLKYENEGNYNHIITLEVFTKLIKYKVIQGDKETVDTYQNINSPKDIEEAFKDINSKYEGVE